MILISVGLYIQLEIGNHNLSLQIVRVALLNIATIFSLILFVYNLTLRWWSASLVVGTFTIFLSIANYYTIAFRDLPISFADIKNLGTAVAVLDGYDLFVDKNIVMCIFLFILITILAILLRFIEKKKQSTWKKILFRCFVSIILITCFYRVQYEGKGIILKPIKPLKTLEWSWKSSYIKYGYVASTIEALQTSLNVITMPVDYTEKTIQEISDKVTGDGAEEGRTPDVILILNESFYDLSLITDLQSDRLYLENFYNVPNAVRGLAVVQNSGGGTNRSEYEFLTSNSLQIMQGITPFNSLDLKNSNSIVKYLKELGYETFAGHPEAGRNYSRVKAYPDLGFDKIYFMDDFQDVDYYGGDSHITDESAYRNLIDVYNEMSESPRLMYLLTIQNHGSWDRSDESYDLIHARTDYGENDDIVDEYLTRIHLSDLALKELMDYFAEVDREVILCMVGDHSPVFAAQLLPEESEMTETEMQLKLRSTPFIIWANFPITNDDVGYVGLPYLIPMVLKAGGVSTSYYYNFMLDMAQEIPILSSYHVYFDKNFDLYKYSEQTKYTDMLEQYFSMEYFNVVGNKDRYQNIFNLN